MNFLSWLEARNLGNLIKKHHDVWLIRFSDIKHDVSEGWYYDWSDTPGSSSISNFEDVSVGDKAADYALNMTPYWVINGLDEKKERIFLDPIAPNPFLTGVGAGGAIFGQHDYDVMSGSNEQKRADQIISAWKKKQIIDPRDVAYLLLGTVPTNVGPNGAQGGWYNSSDTHSNRGGNKRMTPYQIQFADAMTLKTKFGFDVPKRALAPPSDNDEENEQRMLSPDVWNDFVSGGGNATHFDLRGAEIEGEDFSDPHACAKMVIDHPQSAIKTRNAIKLIEMFRHKNPLMLTRGKIYKTRNPKRRNQKFAKMRIGGYANKELEPLIKETAIKLAKIQHANVSYDPYYLAKEQFIILAGQMGWMDILSVYEDAPDPDNRSHVFESYQGTYGNKKNIERMWAMLDKETHPGNLGKFLSRLTKVNLSQLKQWIEENEDKLNDMIVRYNSQGKDSVGSYHAKELKAALDYISRLDPSTFRDWM